MVIKNSDVNYLDYYGSTSYFFKLVLFRQVCERQVKVRNLSNITWGIRKRYNLNVVSIRMNKISICILPVVIFIEYLFLGALCRM